MTLEAQDWYLVAAGASVVGALTVALVGAYVFRNYKRARVVSGIQAEFNGLSPDRDYGRVRERNPAVRMGSLPALKELESRSATAPALVAGKSDGESAPTNLVPFERGYAFTGFSKPVH